MPSNDRKANRGNRMLKGKKAIFFDAGFTLVEPTESVADVYVRLAHYFCNDLDELALRQRIGQIWQKLNVDYRNANPGLESSEALERDAWRRFTRAVAQPFPELESKHSDWHVALVSHFDSPNAWRPIAGVEDVLATLRAQQTRLGVVSNWHSALDGILEGLRLRRHFEFVLTSAAAGFKKPHAAIFQQALAEFQVNAADTAHIGDTWHEDVEGALACGILPVHYDAAGKTAERLQQNGVRSIRDLRELIT